MFSKPLYFSSMMTNIKEDELASHFRKYQGKHIQLDGYINEHHRPDIARLHFDKPGSIRLGDCDLDVPAGTYDIPTMCACFVKIAVSECVGEMFYLNSVTRHALGDVINTPVYQKLGDNILVYKDGCVKIAKAIEKPSYELFHRYHKIYNNTWTIKVMSKNDDEIQEVFQFLQKTRQGVDNPIWICDIDKPTIRRQSRIDQPEYSFFHFKTDNPPIIEGLIRGFSSSLMFQRRRTQNELSTKEITRLGEKVKTRKIMSLEILIEAGILEQYELNEDNIMTKDSDCYQCYQCYHDLVDISNNQTGDLVGRICKLCHEKWDIKDEKIKDDKVIPQNIYIAGDWFEPPLKTIRAFEFAGCNIVHKWWKMKELVNFKKDLEQLSDQVEDADWFIFDFRGGDNKDFTWSHIASGMAFEQEKPIIIISNTPNSFYDNCLMVKNEHEALKILKQHKFLE